MNEQIEQTRLRLASLIDINQLLMSTVEPDNLLQLILESAIRLFAVEGCSIGLIDEARGELAFVAMAGKAKVEEFRVELGQGIAGAVAETGEGVVSNNVSHDTRFFDGVDQQTGFKTQSILCAPLRQSDRLIGVIEALNTSNPEGFTDDDLQLLMAFGGLAATALDRVKVFAAVRRANTAFRETLEDRYPLVMHTSGGMQEVVRLARTVASRNTTVLLTGESGTGKEVLARALHRWSARAENPFVAVNCVALAAELLESELFGHEKGAFTGAIAQKKGKFELAEGGTIFLDEIGELAPQLQAKLLRVLQEREFQRVGGEKDIRADVRILAATNRDLNRAVQDGTFREDLYYRLNVVAILLPPLRDRREDIPMLAQHFVERYCREMKRVAMGIGPPAMELLQSYAWPGNVRQLQNVIERAVVLSPGPNIVEADLPPELRGAVPDPEGASDAIQFEETLSLTEATNAFKRARIRNALGATGGNQTEAARLLGIPQSNLSRLMKGLGLR